MAKKKYYVVWAGRNPGVYDDWDDAREQIEEFPGARYKGFSTSAEAAEAWRREAVQTDGFDLGKFLAEADARNSEQKGSADYRNNSAIDLDGWAVDASCLGNPGRMEYRGVELRTGKEIFRVGPFEKGTNNIGEFLAIVHALALMFNKGEWHTIYSDSATGMAWVRNRQIRTQLKPVPENRRLFETMGRALNWVRTHNWPVSIRKWQTELWGEIPADFGRK